MDYDNTETLQSLRLLPQEIIEEEILSRVAVKSLLRFRCVSKSWRSLIDSDWFIKHHYRNSTKNTSLAHHRVIFNWGFSKKKQCYLQSMLDQARTRPSPFDEETDNKPITVEASVVGCCNGLFCLVKYGRYFLWNPATKIFFKLPKIPPTDSYPYVQRKRGFSWDETTGAYKVFALSSDPDRNNKRVARVYSSNTNSWTTIDHGSLSLYNEVGFYACGNLHWLTVSGDRMVRIESFDLTSETFGKIKMPPGGGEVQAYGVNRLRLGEVRGCLSVMRKLWRGGADVWVMKEHGSWQKFFLIRDYHCRSQRCVSLPCGEVLLICGRNVFSVCSGVVKRKKVSRYERWRSSVKGLLTGWYEGCYNCMDLSLDLDAYDTFLYVESLVTPLPH